MPDQTAWLFFGALLFLFMGLGLAVDPEIYAQSVADWPSLSDGEAREARRLTARLCRACGALFLGVSAWGWAAVVGLPVGLAERLAALTLAPPERLVAGVAATLLSLSMSAVKMFEGVHPGRQTLKGRTSFWSGWAVVFTLMAFGAFLLSRATIVR